VGRGGNEAFVLPRTPATGRVVLPESEPDLAAVVRKLMDAKYQWSDGLIVELKPS
jgi:hypothetical protein